MSRDGLLLKCKSAIRGLQDDLEKEKEWREEVQQQKSTLEKRLLDKEKELSETLCESNNGNNGLMHHINKQAHKLYKYKELYQEGLNRTQALEIKLNRASTRIERLHGEAKSTGKSKQKIKDLSFAKMKYMDRFEATDNELSSVNEGSEFQELVSCNAELRRYIESLEKEKSDLNALVLRLQTEKAETKILSTKQMDEKLQDAVNLKEEELHNLKEQYEELVISKESMIYQLEDSLNSEKVRSEIIKQSESDSLILMQQLQLNLKDKDNEVIKFEELARVSEEKSLHYKELLSDLQKEVQILTENYDRDSTANRSEVTEISMKESRGLLEKYKTDIRAKENEISALLNSQYKLQELNNELGKELSGLLEKYEEEKAKNRETVYAAYTENQELQQENSRLTHKFQLDTQSMKEERIQSFIPVKRETAKFSEEKSKIDYWKQKFIEELGYLSKWLESIQRDQSQSETYHRVELIVGRLKGALKI